MGAAGDRLPYDPLGEAGSVRQALGETDCRGDRIIDDQIDETDAQRFLGAHFLPGQHHLQRPALADKTRERLRGAVGRRQAEIYFGHAQNRRGRDNAESEGERQLQPSAIGKAIERCDAGLRQVPKPENQRMHARNPRRGELLSGSFVRLLAADVGSRAEGATRPSQDQHLRVACLDLIDRCLQLVEDRIVQGIEHGGTIERQDRTLANSLHQYQRHLILPYFGSHASGKPPAKAISLTGLRSLGRSRSRKPSGSRSGASRRPMAAAASIRKPSGTSSAMRARSKSTPVMPCA